MRTLQLTEHCPFSAARLSGPEVDAIRRMVPSLQLQPTPGLPGRYDLRPGSQVGIVRAGDLLLEISPKLPIQRVLFMLSYSIDGRWWRDDEATLEQRSGLVEAIIPGFAFQVRRALRRGLLQGYETREEAIPLVRGRVRFDDQIRYHYGRIPPVEVRHDEFTEDIEANRAIKAATTRLRCLPLRSRHCRRLLAQLDFALAAIPDATYDPRRVPVIIYNRLNAHYRPAVELARAILRAMSFDLAHGEVSAQACLFDMNKVFEDFVVAALREQLGLTESTFPQGAAGRSLHLDLARRVKLLPDVSWWEGNRPVFVGDVKYKRTPADGVLHPDIYQVLAYAVAADLPGATLIYAAGESDEARHHVPYADKTIEVLAMHLDGPPSAVLAEIERVADRIRHWRQAGESHLPTPHAREALGGTRQNASEGAIS